MAKDKKKSEDVADAGEQLQLLDVSHPLAKDIKRAAKRYDVDKHERMAATKKEVESKTKLLALVKQSGVRPDAEGVIEFAVDGLHISVTPRDELVKVKDDGEDGA